MLFSCATSNDIVLPSGQKGYTISCGTFEGNSWSFCYEEAGKMCPVGYEIVEKFETNLERTILINCKN